MGQNLKENIKTVPRVVKESCCLVMAALMMESSLTIKLKDMEFINERMERNMKVIGKQIK